MRYRYRTPVLVGQWQPNEDQACEDAVRAKQALRQNDGTIMWRVPGVLETAAAGELPGPYSKRTERAQGIVGEI